MTHVWDAKTCLSDHSALLSSWVTVLTSTVSTLSPKVVETTHLAVNSVNKCPFCTSLHGNLGRMANVCAKRNADDPTLAAVWDFAVARAKGDWDAKLTTKSEEVNAASVHPLCLFLIWGSLGGNTLLAGLGEIDWLFRVPFTLWYAPLYLLIVITSTLLRLFPSNGSPIVNKVMGGILWAVAGFWIVPVGIVAKLAGYSGSRV